MVLCACGKPLDKVPTWLSSVTIEFICNNCPKRNIKSITQLTPEQITGAPRNAEDDLAAVDSFEEEKEAEA